MTGLVLALAAASGVYLLYTGAVLGWSGTEPLPRLRTTGHRRALADVLHQAGLSETSGGELAGALAGTGAVAAVLAWALFGGVVAPALGAVVAWGALTGSYRARRARRIDEARQAWPRLIEEMRLQTGSLGRSVPQALFEVGRRGPRELRAAFAAAERQWLVSTDFASTVAVLKTRLADPTADAVCETLLVAHEVGGTDVDRRLAALAEDRIQELEGRRDAAAKQAGARFARRFVLLVPLAMALAGLSIGDGRAAYATPAGQTAVVVSIAAVAACWIWAGRLMRMPEGERVFRD